MNIRITFIVALLLFFTCTIGAQTITDTIYYDAHWSICEQPIAKYYRTGSLEKQVYWFFSGKTRDYYTNGQPEMDGYYTTKGIKDGLFTFYYPNGKIRKQGIMRDGTMIGLWSYYWDDGSVYCQLSCTNNNYFLPFFLTAINGDTLVKDGTGKFTINTDQLPDVFSRSPGLVIKGECFQNQKEGKWLYYSLAPDNHLIGSENYKSGNFKSGEFLDEANAMQPVDGPVDVIDLTDMKFEATENFQLESIFTVNRSIEEAQAEALNFLIKKEVPTIDARRFSAHNNLFSYIELCKLAIEPESIWPVNTTNYYRNNNEKDTAPGISHFLIDYVIQSDARQIDGQLFSPITPFNKKFLQVDFTLEPDGILTDIIAKGNIKKETLEHLVYYLARLNNLIPEKQGDSAIRKKDHFYLFVRFNEFKYRKNKFVLSRLILSMHPEQETLDNFDPRSFRIVEKGNEMEIYFDK